MNATRSLRRLLFVTLSAGGALSAQGQNCTVNAGVPQTICITSPLTLTGTNNGLFANGTSNFSWSKVSGPSAVIASATSASTAVTNLSAGVYTFRLSSVCQDGVTATNDVQVTVIQNVTRPDAGPDQAPCVATSGTPVQLAANAPAAGETASWTALPTTNALFSSASSPTATFTGNTNTSYSVIWTITNGTCQRRDTAKINVTAGTTPVSAGPDQTLTCGGSAVTLAGSVPGLAPQGGLWTVLSGPSGAILSDATNRNASFSNLTTGTYLLEWAVSGPCVNGKDTVKINVLNTFAAPSLGGNQSLAPFCNSAGASAFVLTAAAPAQNQISAAWTVQSQPSGSSPVSFGSPNNNSTTVSNLNGVGTYVFRYSASNGNCSAYVDHTVFFTPPVTGLSTPGSQIVPCNDSQATVSFTYSYGGSTNATGLTRTATVLSQPAGANATTTRSGNPGSDVWTVKNMGKTGAYVVRFEWTNPCGSQYRDVTFNTSFPSGAVNAGSDPLMACNVTYTTMSGNPPPTGVTGVWSQVSGPNQANITQPNNPGCLMTGMVPGTYVFRWQLMSGNSCMSPSDEAVAVVASATVVQANAGPDRAVCNSFPVKLSANTPGPTQTGLWTSIPAGGTIADPNAPNTTVTGLSPNTTYKFIWRIANACDTSRDTTHLTTNSATSQITVSAGANQCKPVGTTSVTLSGSAPATATPSWTALDGGTINSPNSQNTTVTLSGNGVRRFVYTLAIPNCDTVTDTVSVQISPAATTAAAGADLNMCIVGTPASVTLTGNTPTQGTPRWSLINGHAAATIASPTAPSTAVNNLLPGAYFFEYAVENGLCPASRDTVRVLLGQGPSTASVSTTTPTLCNAASGNVTLNAVAPTAGTGVWTVLSAPAGAPAFAITNGSTNAATVPVTSLITGTYKFKYTITNSPVCPSSSDSLSVDISRPAASMSTTDVNLCNVTAINLVGTPNTNGTWTVANQPAGSPAVTLGSAFGNQATASNLVQGTYQFTYTIPSAGACAATSASRNYINGTPAPASNAGADQYLCTGTASVTLTGSTAAVAGASWSRVSGPNSGTAGTANTNYADTTINGLADGVYTFRYTTKGTGSCPTESDDMLVIREKKANAGTDKAICGNGSVQMTGTVPAYYTATWSQISGPNTASISNTSAPNTAIGNLVPGTYYFRYVIDGPASCAVNDDTVKVQVDQPFTYTAGSDVSVCKGSPAFAIGTAAATGISYSWSPATALSASNIAQPNFNPAAEGTYSYLVTARSGVCQVVDDINVVVKPLPTVPQFSVPAPICGNASATVSITNADPATTYTWSGGYGTGASKTVAPGTYTITTQRDGCAGAAPTNVTLNSKAVPSAAFTASASCHPTFIVTTPTTGATYTWNFGAGATPGNYTGTTANQGPINYSPLGAKTVSLIVAAPNGCSDTVSNAFTASCVPPATQFSASTTELCTGPVAFTNTTTVGDGPFTYKYNFGDGTPDVTTADATHTYGTAGTYTVTFTVTGAAGAVSATKTITVKPRPDAGFAINATPQPLSSNVFTFTASGPAQNLYTWAFGDGSIGQYATVSRSYAAAGIYNVTLTATDVVNGCTATLTKSVTVTSDSVSSGNVGGIESESLGGLVTRRDFNRIKLSLNKPQVYTALPLFTTSKTSIAAVAKGTGSVQGLADMMPATLAPGDVPRVSTPTDLTALTIAAEALSVDYTRQNVNKAVVLGIKTFDRPYNHTKSICDRFRGATLLSIEPVTLRGMAFSRFALQREDGVVEHAIAFDAGRSAGSEAYRLQSDWVISAYAKDDTVYNFQVWAATPADAEKLALDVLDKQNSYRSLQRFNSGVTVPPVYVTKGIRHKDTLLLTVRNTGDAVNATMDFNVQSKEEGGRSALQVSVPLHAHADTVVALPIGDGYEYEGLMHADTQLVDQFYLADGNWGLDYDGHYTSIKNYAPENDPTRVYGDSSFPLYRKVDLKTVSSDYVTLYKAIKPGTEPADLSQYRTLKFHAAGTGKAVVRITRGGITDWAAQYKTEIELTEAGKDYAIAFEDFASDKLGDAFAPKDAKTLSFTLAAPNGQETALNLAVSGAEFSKEKTKSVRGLDAKALTVAPNPTKGPFQVTFSADATRELLMTVSDITGRVLWEQPVQATVGSNTVDVRIAQPLAAGTTLLVNLRDGNTQYDPAKVTVH